MGFPLSSSSLSHSFCACWTLACILGLQHTVILWKVNWPADLFFLKAFLCHIFCSSRAYWYWTSTFVKDFFNIVRFVYFAGMMIHATGKMLAIIFPIAFSVLRLLFSGYAMSWCAFWFTYFSIFWHTYDFLFFLCVGMKLCCMKSYILSHNNVYVIGIACLNLRE